LEAVRLGYKISQIPLLDLDQMLLISLVYRQLSTSCFTGLIRELEPELDTEKRFGKNTKIFIKTSMQTVITHDMDSVTWLRLLFAQLS